MDRYLFEAFISALTDEVARRLGAPALPQAVAPVHAAPIAAPLPVAATAAPVAADEYVTAREAAALLHVSVKTLEKMRAESRGPKYKRIGRAVRYLRSDLISSG